MASPALSVPPRVAAWQSMVKDAGLAALILMDPQSVQHVTGMNAIINSMPSIVIVLPDEEPLLLVNALRVERANDVAHARQIFGYGNFFGNSSIAGSWPEAVRKLLQQRTILKGCIGYMASGLTVKQLNTLVGCAPDADFEDVEDQFGALRHVKNEDEINLVRIAGKIADAGADAGIAKIKSGGSEQEVTDATNAAMADYRRKHYPDIEVSDFGNPHGALFNGNQSWCLSGPRTKVSCDAPSSRVPQIGERVFLLIWANAGGYHAEKELMWFKGDKAPEADSKLLQDVRDAMAAMYKQVKPGALLSTIHLAGEKILEERGWEGFTASRNGHSIGLDAHEEPSVSAGSPLRLKEGMIITIEPNVSKKNVAATRISETILITGDGFEFITNPDIGNHQKLGNHFVRLA